MAVQRDQAALEPRRAPTQARSRRRVNLILDAAAELVVERGFDGITTRSIAEKASIPVGSIYQFFPNKSAILNALAVRHLEMFAAVLEAFLEPSNRGLGLDDLVDMLVNGLTDVLFSNKAIPVVWSGMQNSPELREVEARGNSVAVDFHMVIFERFLSHLDEERRRVIAQSTLRVTYAVLFYASHEGEQYQVGLVEELKTILKAYLGRYTAEAG